MGGAHAGNLALQSKRDTIGARNAESTTLADSPESSPPLSRFAIANDLPQPLGDTNRLLALVARLTRDDVELRRQKCARFQSISEATKLLLDVNKAKSVGL